jgi:hypothetical protein
MKMGLEILLRLSPDNPVTVADLADCCYGEGAALAELRGRRSTAVKYIETLLHRLILAGWLIQIRPAGRGAGGADEVTLGAFHFRLLHEVFGPWGTTRLDPEEYHGQLSPAGVDAAKSILPRAKKLTVSSER